MENSADKHAENDAVESPTTPASKHPANSLISSAKSFFSNISKRKYRVVLALSPVIFAVFVLALFQYNKITNLTGSRGGTGKNNFNPRLTTYTPHPIDCDSYSYNNQLPLRTTKMSVSLDEYREAVLALDDPEDLQKLFPDLPTVSQYAYFPKAKTLALLVGPEPWKKPDSQREVMLYDLDTKKLTSIFSFKSVKFDTAGKMSPEFDFINSLQASDDQSTLTFTTNEQLYIYTIGGSDVQQYDLKTNLSTINQSYDTGLSLSGAYLSPGKSKAVIQVGLYEGFLSMLYDLQTGVSNKLPFQGYGEGLSFLGWLDNSTLVGMGYGGNELTNQVCFYGTDGTLSSCAPGLAQATYSGDVKLRDNYLYYLEKVEKPTIQTLCDYAGKPKFVTAIFTKVMRKGIDDTNYEEFLSADTTTFNTYHSPYQIDNIAFSTINNQEALVVGYIDHNIFKVGALFNTDRGSLFELVPRTE